VSRPLLEVDHLGLATRAGPVFSDVSFTVGEESLTIVVGPAGSGRSALLLAVSGRMRGVVGSVRLSGHPGPTRPRDLRAVTAVARLSTLVQPEGQLSVGESVTERALLDGVHPAAAEAAVTAAEELLDERFDRNLLVDQLDAYRRTLLCVVLALVRPAELLVLDDADRSLDLADQRRLFDALTRVASQGRSLLISTSEIAVVPGAAQVVRLPAPPTTAPATPQAPTPMPKKTA
jgi:ABC-2 type transport system ATP-binding protein